MALVVHELATIAATHCALGNEADRPLGIRVDVSEAVRSIDEWMSRT